MSAPVRGRPLLDKSCHLYPPHVKQQPSGVRELRGEATASSGYAVYGKSSAEKGQGGETYHNDNSKVVVGRSQFGTKTTSQYFKALYRTQALQSVIRVLHISPDP